MDTEEETRQISVLCAQLFRKLAPIAVREQECAASFSSEPDGSSHERVQRAHRAANAYSSSRRELISRWARRMAKAASSTSRGYWSKGIRRRFGRGELRVDEGLCSALTRFDD